MKLSTHQKTIEIPSLLKEYLSDKELSQAQFCKASNIGEAYVSQIIQGKTTIAKTEIKDKYYTAICDAIGHSLIVETWRHFNTDNFKIIINKLRWARENKERLVLDGDTGAGKSYACAKYKQKYPANTFLVTCLSIENSKEFCINIAETIGVETHGTSGKIIKRVVKRLLSLDDAFLIIDEAEHIEKKSGYINIIKSLADLLDGKVPVVLAGMDITKILTKGFDKRKQNFRQTARRFSKREKCVESISDDVYRICTELGVKNKHSQNWLANRIHNFGELKTILVAAIEEANQINEPVTTKLLQSVYE